MSYIWIYDDRSPVPPDVQTLIGVDRFSDQSSYHKNSTPAVAPLYQSRPSFGTGLEVPPGI